MFAKKRNRREYNIFTVGRTSLKVKIKTYGIRFSECQRIQKLVYWYVFLNA